MYPDWNRVIRECRRNFGAPPRKFSLWDRLTYLRVPKPGWLWIERSDNLIKLFRGKRKLFNNGRVVWGHIVQANQLMFRPGSFNCPGELVYPASPEEQIDPGILEEVAHSLFSLKGTIPEDPHLKPIAHYLYDEMIRVYGLRVPATISPDVKCLVSTTFFVRHHLPGRRLNCPLLPIVVAESKPRLALPLPERYWPKQFAQWWTQPLWGQGGRS